MNMFGKSASTKKIARPGRLLRGFLLPIPSTMVPPASSCELGLCETHQSKAQAARGLLQAPGAACWCEGPCHCTAPNLRNIFGPASGLGWYENARIGSDGGPSGLAAPLDRPAHNLGLSPGAAEGAADSDAPPAPPRRH